MADFDASKLAEEALDQITNPDGDHAQAVIVALINKVREEALEEAAKVSDNPYSDEVDCYGSDQPAKVAMNIAQAIRALKGAQAKREG